MPAGSAEKELVFHGHNGLWITLAVLAALGTALTLFTLAADLIGGTTDGTVAALVTGGGLSLLLGLGAWFAAGQRREVALDEEGLTVRAPGGAVRTRVRWDEVAAIETRPMPSQRLRLAIFINRRDGTAVLIDPQQVGDTEMLAREARRLHQNASRRAPDRRTP